MCNIIYQEEEKTIIEKMLNISVGGELYRVNINDIKRKKNIRLTEKEHKKKGKILSIYEVDDKKYYLYTSKSGIPYITDNINCFCKVKQNLKCHITKKYVYFYGRSTNINHKIDNFDNVFLNEKKVCKIKRFSKKKILKDLVIFRIKIEKIMNSGEIHSTLRIGKNRDISVPVCMKRRYKGINYYKKKRIGDKLVLIRSIVNGNKIRITNIPFEREYTALNLFKNWLAKVMQHFIFHKNKIILLFEKETGKANESGYYVFEKIMEKRNKQKLKSDAYFIIDKDSNDYSRIKEKYGRNIIKKYSFRHYLYIYKSKYFISSELSNHVINPRLYIRSLNECISKKPLIFLQHGIMFAKPVDNPAAKGFYKSNRQIRIYKSVISSDLEAEQFYRMGYSRNDLIKCGLTKFDISYMSEDADRIMYMPTYRYWEEANILNEAGIKETTYFKSYIKVINAFKEANLLDRLVISCHPKFAEYLTAAIPEYACLIQNDINKGLEEARIFITDYSSAAYDAHYRGAYIIYNWEEKDYLIENYKAIPPINEENCDGVPVYDVGQLINEVKKAIACNYKMEQIYEEHYRRINEFSDGRNGDRLIDELMRLDII